MNKRLEVEREQAESDKRIMLNVLGICRTAEDVPDLQGNRIVAKLKGYEKLILYVPDGSHTLKISSRWSPTAKQDSWMNDVAPEAAGAGEKSWDVPLLPDCGYCLTLESDRKGGPVEWELTSNHPEFTTQAETVPIDGFSSRGYSWAESDVVQFPNQIERFSVGKLEELAKTNSGVKVMNVTLNGPSHDQPYEVLFDVRVVSDGPACVSASEAKRIIILRREDLLLPYKGGGKYDIQVSHLKKPAPG